MPVEKVVLLGLGRIGLPTAACLAEAGLDVLGVDISQARLDDIEQGRIGHEEPGLAEIVGKSISSSSLRLSDSPEGGDAFILCVPTPLAEDKTCDMSYLDKALRSIAPFLRSGNLVVLESTVPVGTMRDFVIPRLKSLGVDVHSVLFASAPERIISGRMLEEIREDDRVIGAATKQAAQATRNLYRNFVRGKILLTDTSTAELVKLIENTCRDVNIAFANEVALFCDREGMDAWRAIELANHHPRVNIHRPGPGVGGHCIPVVPYFLAQHTKHSIMLGAARKINDSMPRYVSNLIMRAVSGLPHPKVALMGVAYKANSSDMVNSPALQLMDLLRRENLKIVLYDPLVRTPDLHTVEFEEALASDCLVFLVPHDIFRELEPTSPRKGRGTVIDVGNCVDLSRWASKGWNVQGFAKSRP